MNGSAMKITRVLSFVILGLEKQIDFQVDFLYFTIIL